ncbi:MAG: hypothetical protein U0R49_11570 [Fimbriimonadales bacterium]
MLGTGQASKDIDFVRQELHAVVLKTQQAVEGLPEQTAKELQSQLGTEQGQVLHPVKAKLDDVEKRVEAQLKNVETLINEKVDVNNTKSPIAEAIGTVKSLLDPDKKDSIQNQITDVIADVSKHDGALAKNVEAVVAKVLEPLTKKITEIDERYKATEHKQQGIDETIEKTTLKGVPFEEQIIERIKPVCKAFGTTPEHVGKDNQAGDILVCLSDDGPAQIAMKIVISAKDDKVGRGRKRLTDDLEKAMVERHATAGIFVGKERAALGKEIGELGEGAATSGPWIACLAEGIEVALRLTIIKAQLVQRKAEDRQIDAAVVATKTKAIRTTLSKVAQINSQVTSGTTSLDNIRGIAKALQQEIGSHLDEIESVLRTAEGQKLAEQESDLSERQTQPTLKIGKPISDSPQTSTMTMQPSESETLMQPDQPTETAQSEASNQES